MVKLVRTKNQARGPSSALGIMSFSDPRKAIIKITPELMLVIAIVFGLIILGIQLL